MAKKSGPDFESSLRRLQEIVQELERADLPLERNVALYKEGCALAGSCRAMLDKARHEISLCGEDGVPRPFSLEGGPGDPADDRPGNGLSDGFADALSGGEES